MNVREIIAKNYTKWQPKAIALACDTNPDKIGTDEAEDIFQDVIEQLLEEAGNLTQLTEAFVLRRVRQKAIDYLRSQDNKVSLSADEGEEAITPEALINGETPEQLTEEKLRLNEYQCLISDAMMLLTPVQFDVVDRICWKNQSKEDVAREKGISPQAVANIYDQALTKMAKYMEKHSPDKR